MSNRVVEVQQKFAPECWRHCPGQSNPADLPSRGVLVDKIQGDLWQKGPTGLKLPEAEWPQQDRVCEPRECLDEERKSKITPVLLSNARMHPEETCRLKNVIDIARFSTLDRLHRVTAWVLRWRAICANRTSERGDLTTEELQRAESLWLKELQEEEYAVEHARLQAGDEISRQSSIYSLRPFLDQGLMKVRGRLQEADLSHEEKHPNIVPLDTNMCDF